MYFLFTFITNLLFIYLFINILRNAPFRNEIFQKKKIFFIRIFRNETFCNEIFRNAFPPN